MKGPFGHFTELGLSGRVLLDRSLFNPDDAIEREAVDAMARQGLRPQRDEMLGAYIVLPCEADGSPWKGRGTPYQGTLERSPLYSAVRPDEVLAGVRAHIAAIAERHGPGRVWFLLATVHLIDFDGQVAGGILDVENVGEYRHTQDVGILRTFYGHEKQIRV